MNRLSAKELLVIRRKVIERRDGRRFLMVLPPRADPGYLEQRRRRPPAHKFRRLHVNLPGLPEGSAVLVHGISPARTKVQSHRTPVRLEARGDWAACLSERDLDAWRHLKDHQTCFRNCSGQYMVEVVTERLSSFTKGPSVDRHGRRRRLELGGE